MPLYRPKMTLDDRNITLADIYVKHPCMYRSIGTYNIRGTKPDNLCACTHVWGGTVDSSPDLINIYCRSVERMAEVRPTVWIRTGHMRIFASNSTGARERKMESNFSLNLTTSAAKRIPTRLTAGRQAGSMRDGRKTRLYICFYTLNLTCVLGPRCKMT